MANITKTCARCQKQFIVLEQEQRFLSEKGLALPTNCPTCRQIRRLTLRGGERMLYKTKCQKCQQEIVVAFNPQKVTNPILCKKDYDQYFLENDMIIKEPLPEI